MMMMSEKLHKQETKWEKRKTLLCVDRDHLKVPYSAKFPSPQFSALCQLKFVLFFVLVFFFSLLLLCVSCREILFDNFFLLHSITQCCLKKSYHFQSNELHCSRRHCMQFCQSSHFDRQLFKFQVLALPTETSTFPDLWVVP